MPQLDATSQKGYYLVIYIKYLQKYMVFFRNYWSHGTKILCVWKASSINNDADAKRVQIFRRVQGGPAPNLFSQNVFDYLINDLKIENIHLSLYKRVCKQVISCIKTIKV